MTNGIYTLANDVVYDQFVALLNSIEANAGKDMPICVIPYDNRLEKVKAEIERRAQVTLFENTNAIADWENFATQAWKAHQRAQTAWQARGLPSVYRLSMHRKLCAFDGPFDKFIYFDADTLLMGELDLVYQKLDEYDWVANDFQYKSDIKYIFDVPEAQLLQVFDREKLKSHIACAGWFASKKNVFSPEKVKDLQDKLTTGEAEVMALWGPDQSLFNYMVLRSNISYYNFAYHDNANATGSHWSSPYEVRDWVLYDRGRKITYIHYMSVPSSKFTALCAGEDIEIPYRDVFLHYRYLNCPEQRPQLTSPSAWVKWKRTMTKLIRQKVSNLQSRFLRLKSRWH